MTKNRKRSAIDILCFFFITTFLSIVNCGHPPSVIQTPPNPQFDNLENYHIVRTFESITVDALGYVYTGPQEGSQYEYIMKTPFYKFEIDTIDGGGTLNFEGTYKDLAKLGLEKILYVDKADTLHYLFRINTKKIHKIKGYPIVHWSQAPQQFKGRYISGLHYGERRLFKRSSKGKNVDVKIKDSELFFGRYVWDEFTDARESNFIMYDTSSILIPNLESPYLEHKLNYAIHLWPTPRRGEAITMLDSLHQKHPEYPQISFNLACVYSESLANSLNVPPSLKDSLLDLIEGFYLESLDSGIVQFYRVMGQTPIPYWRILNDASLTELFKNRPYLRSYTDSLRKEAGELDILHLDSSQQSVAKVLYNETLGEGPCFAKGTLITLFSGKTVPIERIRIGDTLLSYDLNAKQLEPSVVQRVFVHFADSLLIINGDIMVTANHPFFTDGSWITAQNLEKGKKLLRSDLTWEKVIRKSKIRYDDNVYNLELDNNSNYFANEVLVHNKLIVF
jgi:hypothetical protein